LTSQQVILLDALQYKHVKLQEKASLSGARLLRVTEKEVIFSDPLQGFQVLAMPTLATKKQWKFSQFKE